jgi:hypothetical protein
MSILIKYNLERDDLVEGNYYSTKFEFNKCFGIIENYYESDKIIEDKLKMIEKFNCEIIMKYAGISRIDGLSLFVLDEKQILRNQKINQILK